MASFSRTSRQNLATCNDEIQKVLHVAIMEFDFSVICGHRGELAQREAFLRGASRLDWPNSKHNGLPSLAVDLVPYPLDWRDEKQFAFIAGRIVQIAGGLGVELRWGGDWDRDTRTRDQQFHDLPHFELV